MSELELSTTRNVVKGLKRRSKTEYFDVTMAILNLIVIIYVFLMRFTILNLPLLMKIKSKKSISCLFITISTKILD